MGIIYKYDQKIEVQGLVFVFKDRNQRDLDVGLIPKPEEEGKCYLHFDVGGGDRYVISEGGITLWGSQLELKAALDDGQFKISEPRGPRFSYHRLCR